MEAIRVQQVLDQDGETCITDLPYKKGGIVELIVLSQPEETRSRPVLRNPMRKFSDWTLAKLDKRFGLKQIRHS